MGRSNVAQSFVRDDWADYLEHLRRGGQRPAVEGIEACDHKAIWPTKAHRVPSAC
jgi:hypothetical protein